MEHGVMVEGVSFGPVSRFANREFVKTPSPSPESSPDKEVAHRREYDPFDFFDVLDMLAEEGSLGDVEDLPGPESKGKAGKVDEAVKAAVKKKHPMVCKERNVVRYQPFPRIPDEQLDKVKDPVLREQTRALMAQIEERRKKSWAEAERRRLDYLKNAL